jgi:UDP-N-acetylglucosamine 2-epimerase (non-hydrolysing)
MPLPSVMVVVGTRPEAIKQIPVILELRRHAHLLRTVVASTGQHREMLDQMLGAFAISVDHEMSLMAPDQSLFQLGAKALLAFERVLTDDPPALLLVQGDTSTAMLGALAASYRKIPVGHVEAGLRTGDKHFPFPEEVNRRVISTLADLHFAPTKSNYANLLKENVPPARVFITGNTVIDTLHLARAMDRPRAAPPKGGSRQLLVTAHRRESFGGPLAEIFHALRELASLYPDLRIVYPVHLNPNVLAPARALLGGLDNVHLTEPMGYFPFVDAMAASYLVLTDSGGVQEEAPALGVPVLVLRNETERGEAIAAGTVRLVGTDRAAIVRETRRLLDDPAARDAMARAENPYGDGRAAPRITRHILEFLGLSAEAYAALDDFAGAPASSR